MAEFNSFFTCCIALFIFSAQVSTPSNMQVVDITKSGLRFLVFSLQILSEEVVLRAV